MIPMQMKPVTQAVDASLEDFPVGRSAQHSYQVEHRIFVSFLECFGDFNPLHVDPPYAQSQGFPRNIMHGAMLNGFLSHFIGMIFPGKYTLLLSSEIHHQSPFFEGDTLLLESKVAQRVDAERILVLHFSFTREASEIAKGRLMIKMRR